MTVFQRFFEVFVSAVALLILTPLLVVLAVLVKTSSPGPVIFRQERVGLNGTLFRINKFRTMRQNSNEQALSTAGDTRVTQIGKVLRATKADELPQLWNVLNGTMNLVGPRPEVPRFVHLWPCEARAKVLSVRPGITDPTSILFKDESVLLSRAEDADRYYIDVLIPQKLESYSNYIDNRSFLRDLKIIFETISSLFRNR